MAINELIAAVGIALGNNPVSACQAADTSCNQAVEINELIAAVDASLTPPTASCAVTNWSNPPSSYDGYGWNGGSTTGGSSGQVITVSDNRDFDPQATPPEPAIQNTLRWAVTTTSLPSGASIAPGNRLIQFSAPMTIQLKRMLTINTQNVTLSGWGLSGSGVTLSKYGIQVRDTSNVIVTNVRVRDPNADNEIDGVRVRNSSFVIVDHVSTSGAGDSNIDVTEGSHDVSVRCSILAEPAPPAPKNMLVDLGTYRLSLYHNVYVNGARRNPQAQTLAPSGKFTFDLRNNLIWGWGDGMGTQVRLGATGNIINNFYYTDGGTTLNDASVVVCGTHSRCDVANESNPTGSAFLAGNLNPVSPVTPQTAGVPMPLPTGAYAITSAEQGFTEGTAASGAAHALSFAGARDPAGNLDAHFNGYIQAVRTKIQQASVLAPLRLELEGSCQ